MHEYGITASWSAIYKWLQAADETKYCIPKRTSKELRQAIYEKGEDSWIAYSTLVRRLTRTNINKYQERIDPKNLRSKEWHVDHKFSIHDGFIEDLDPRILAHPVNLQVIRRTDNQSKLWKSCISKQTLLKGVKNESKLFR